LAVKKKATAKRKTKKKATAKKRTTKKKASKSKTKKLPFGGYAINFAGRTETVEQVFGNKPIAPSEMTKRIWKFVKSKSLSNR
jgi:hypothetical protein